MSTWSCPVVEVCARRHPNADKLGLVTVFGYQICVGIQDFPINEIRTGVFIPPDSVCDTSRNCFAFLGNHPRIKVVRLRGERSEGLVLPYAGPLHIGDDASGELGVVKWESPADRAGNGYDLHGQKQGRRNFTLRQWWNPRCWYRWFMARRDKKLSAKAAPPFSVHKYDVENYRRYPVIAEGENVVITEKLHGTNARFVFSRKTGRLHIGSPTMWKRPDLPSWWSDAVLQNEWLLGVCKDNPDVVFYGEIVSASVQGLHYGFGEGNFGVRLFDVFDRHGSGWASWSRVKDFWWLDSRIKSHWVPVLYEGPMLKMEVVEKGFVSGKETVSGLKLHIREGVVVETVEPREAVNLGRVKLKLVSPEYLAMED